MSSVHSEFIHDKDIMRSDVERPTYFFFPNLTSMVFQPLVIIVEFEVGAGHRP